MVRHLQVRLLGKFEASWNGQCLTTLDGQKNQELLAYLLLHKDVPLSREKVAHLMWPDCSSTFQAKKYLRKALWKIQSSFSLEPELQAILKVDPEWIELISREWLAVDVYDLEEAYRMVENKDGALLNDSSIDLLDSIVQNYRGEFLEGRYMDWCLFVRERFELMFLILLDKLMNYCEANHFYERGCFYGLNILRFDPAREQTHRRLMRLYAKANMRVEAIRQYNLCIQILKDELDIEPSQLTKQVFYAIQEDASGFNQMPALNGDEQLSVNSNLMSCIGKIEDSLTELKDIVYHSGLAQ